MTVQSSDTHSKQWDAGTHLSRRGLRLNGAIFVAFSMLARHENHLDELQ
jgi:hypothetical protein